MRALQRFTVHESASVERLKQAGITLTACLRKYGLKEQLSENDMWYCSKCKEHRRAFKKMDLWSPPDILIVHLKRFQYAVGTYFVHTTKLDDLVEFPVVGLDISEFVANRPEGSPPFIYDLFAVSVSGTERGRGGGHTLCGCVCLWVCVFGGGITRVCPRFFFCILPRCTPSHRHHARFYGARCGAVSKDHVVSDVCDVTPAACCRTMRAAWAVATTLRFARTFGTASGTTSTIRT
jgi:hypothetical protein